MCRRCKGNKAVYHARNRSNVDIIGWQTYSRRDTTQKIGLDISDSHSHVARVDFKMPVPPVLVEPTAGRRSAPGLSTGALAAGHHRLEYCRRASEIVVDGEKWLVGFVQGAPRRAAQNSAKFPYPAIASFPADRCGRKVQNCWHGFGQAT